MVLVWFVCVYDCCRLGVLRVVLANGFCGLIVLVVTILIVLLCSVYGCMYDCWGVLFSVGCLRSVCGFAVWF